MKITPQHLLIAAAGFLAGYLASSAVPSAVTTDATAIHTRTSSESARIPNSRRNNTSAKPPKTLKSLRQRAPAMMERSNGLAHEMKRMKTGEIQSLFDSIALMNPKSMQRPDEITAYHILLAAMEELYARQGDALIGWASSPGEPTVTAYRLRLAAEIVGKQSPEKLVLWADHFAALNADVLNTMKFHAVKAAALRTAEETIHAIKVLGQPLYDHGTPTAFAADFDFARLIRALPLENCPLSAVTTWAAKDPEAAWAGVREAMRIQAEAPELYLSALYQGVAASRSDAEAAEWIRPKLTSLTESERDDMIQSAIYQSKDPDQTAAKLLDAYPTDAGKVALAASLMQPAFVRYQDPIGKPYTSGALDALGSKPLQRDAILQAIGNLDPQLRQQATVYFETLADRVGLDQSAKDMIRNELARQPE